MKGNMVLSTVLGTVIGAVGGSAVIGNTASKSIEKMRAMSEKHLALFLLMNEWMKTKQEGKHIKEYFEKNEYKSVAIYGLSYIGEPNESSSNPGLSLISVLLKSIAPSFWIL